MKFCSECDALLESTTASGELKFVCTQCNTEYESTPEESMIMLDSKTSQSLEQYRKLLKNAPFDRTAPRARQPCSKCKRPIVSYILLDDTKKRVFSCECGHVFT